MSDIPMQRQACAAYSWCRSVTRGHRVHVGEAQSVTTRAGTLLQVSLTAEDGDEPFVHLEAAFGPGEPLLEISELSSTEALELAGMLLRQTRTAHAEQQTHQFQ